MKKIFYFFQLIRYHNLIIIAFTVFFAHYFLTNNSIPKDSNFLSLIFLAFSIVFIAAGGYLINDYFDIAIDKINKPDKVLIGKAFSQKIALISYFILNFLGLILGFLLSKKIGVIQVFCVLILYFYASYLKKIALVGNILVAFLSALVVLIINILYQKNFPLIYLFSAFAFFISLIREVLKDVEDIEGDKIGNCQTFPILFGVFRTKVLIFSLILFFVFSLFWLPSWLPLQIDKYIFYVIFISILLLLLAFKVYFSKHKKDFHTASSFCKLIMLSGMVGMIILQV